MPRVAFVTLAGARAREEVASLAPAGFDVTHHSLALPPAELAAAVSDSEFLMIHPGRLPDEVLHAGSGRIRLVQVLAAGYDEINVTLAAKLGIPIANNGGANAVSVAEHAVMLMLALLRRLPACVTATRAGGWRKGATRASSKIRSIPPGRPANCRWRSSRLHSSR